MLTTAEKEYWNHQAEVDPAGGPKGHVLFRWHWPRGTFDRRMSALEIAAFLLPHMPSIVPLLGEHAEIQGEFAALLARLATWPAQVLDEVVPWIKTVTRTEEDEIIELELFRQCPVEAAPSYFLP